MSISSIGIGSGLDAESIIGKLVALERRPLTLLQSKQTDITTRLSLVGQIQSQVAALSDAAKRLGQASAWAGVTATSSNTSAVTATVTGSPSPTSFNVAVQQLAAAQSTSSSAVATGTTFGAGTLNIAIGTWSSAVPPVFTQGTGATVSVTVGASDTLDTIASNINAAKAGVTATVLNDASGQRLLVRSNNTGAAAGFRIQTTGAAGLGALAFDPAVVPATGMAANAYQKGQDANATINGVAVTSATNQVSGAITGVTLQLAQVTTTPALVTLSADTATMRKNINDFVAAYNTLSKTLADATKYDPATKTGGPMQGNSVILGLQSALRRLEGTSSVGSTFSRLTDVGVEMQRGGFLTVNGSKLDTAMLDTANLQALFTTDNKNAATNGFGLKFQAFADGLLNSTGTVTNQTSALQAALKRNAQDQDKVTQRAARVEKQLRAQYSALDGKMSSLSALSSYVSQQVGQWNKSA